MELQLVVPSTACLLLAVYCVYSTSAAVTTTGQPTTVHHTTVHHTTTRRHHHNNHHHHQPTHSPEKIENAHMYFHYDQYSIEKLLVAKEAHTCYAYPLTTEEVHDIHDKLKLLKLEAHLLHQIQSKSYILWTPDDLGVRSRYYERFCNSNATVYRVYRF